MLILIDVFVIILIFSPPSGLIIGIGLLLINFGVSIFPYIFRTIIGILFSTGIFSIIFKELRYSLLSLVLFLVSLFLLQKMLSYKISKKNIFNYLIFIFY